MAKLARHLPGLGNHTLCGKVCLPLADKDNPVNCKSCINVKYAAAKRRRGL